MEEQTILQTVTYPVYLLQGLCEIPDHFKLPDGYMLCSKSIGNGTPKTGEKQNKMKQNLYWRKI